MNDKELDKLFRDGLADLSIPPRADLWTDIAHRLDGQKTVRPPRFRWMKYAAVFIACTGITAITFTWLRPYREEIPPVAAFVDPETEEKNVESDEKAEQTVVKTEEQLPQNHEKIHHPGKKTEKTAFFTHTDTDVLSPEAEKPEILETETKIPLEEEKPILLAGLAMAVPAFSFPEGMETAELPGFAPIGPSTAFAEAETEPTFPEREDSGIVPGLLNRIAATLALNECKNLRISHDGEGSVHLEIARNQHKP